MCSSHSKHSIYTPKPYSLALQGKWKEEKTKMLSFSLDSTPSNFRGR